MCFCLSVAYILKIYIILLMSPQSIYKIKKKIKRKAKSIVMSGKKLNFLAYLTGECGAQGRKDDK